MFNDSGADALGKPAESSQAGQANTRDLFVQEFLAQAPNGDSATGQEKPQQPSDREVVAGAVAALVLGGIGYKVLSRRDEGPIRDFVNSAKAVTDTDYINPVRIPEWRFVDRNGYQHTLNTETWDGKTLEYTDHNGKKVRVELKDITPVLVLPWNERDPKRELAHCRKVLEFELSGLKAFGKLLTGIESDPALKGKESRLVLKSLSEDGVDTPIRCVTPDGKLIFSNFFKAEFDVNPWDKIVLKVAPDQVEVTKTEWELAKKLDATDTARELFKQRFVEIWKDMHPGERLPTWLDDRACNVMKLTRSELELFAGNGKEHLDAAAKSFTETYLVTASEANAQITARRTSPPPNQVVTKSPIRPANDNQFTVKPGSGSEFTIENLDAPAKVPATKEEMLKFLDEKISCLEMKKEKAGPDERLALERYTEQFKAVRESVKNLPWSEVPPEVTGKMTSRLANVGKVGGAVIIMEVLGEHLLRRDGLDR